MMRAREYLYYLATDRDRGAFGPIAKIFLWVFSLSYGIIIWILRLISRFMPLRLPGKVISVGNITMGGTGKTPLAEYIARFLKQEGRAIAILIRGYQANLRSVSVEADEPAMLKKNLPGIAVVVNPDRKQGAIEAKNSFGADTLILDDGFQQWRIKKDLEIVVVDATNPFGNGHLLPRGILREPRQSLARADIIVLTKTDLAADKTTVKGLLKRYNRSCLVVESRHAALGFFELDKDAAMLGPESLKGKEAAVVSGIGDPASFERGVDNLGIRVGLTFRFSDHYYYNSSDLERIASLCRRQGIDTVITTQKDAVRLISLPLKEYGVNFLALRIQLAITENEQEFLNRLHRV
jgi:tetraacyldisaccharide 4'-kinase